jgi:hypothetical protein
MVHGGTEVPPWGSMWRPGAPDGRFFVDEDFDARGGQWGAVEVEKAKDMSICGEVWVKATGTEQVKGLEGLGEQAVPKMHGKFRVSGA